MEHKNNNQKNGSGFMLGVVLGSVATLLFTTKKGREIVKEFVAMGLEKFEEFQEGIDEVIETDLIEDGQDYVKTDIIDPSPSDIEVSVEPKVLADTRSAEDKSKLKSEAKEETPTRKKSSIRRFFKSSKKN